MDTAVLSGRFGHNSNTDAEAELRAFRACVDGRDGMAEACAACGNTTEVGRQDPCGARTNTADSIWTETSSATSGGLRVEDKLDVIRDPHAGTQLEQPVCAWGKFPVHGM
jgi:hypothetical protein